jgi:hypothetical protein
MAIGTESGPSFRALLEPNGHRCIPALAEGTTRLKAAITAEIIERFHDTLDTRVRESDLERDGYNVHTFNQLYRVSPAYTWVTDVSRLRLYFAMLASTDCRVTAKALSCQLAKGVYLSFRTKFAGIRSKIPYPEISGRMEDIEGWSHRIATALNLQIIGDSHADNYARHISFSAPFKVSKPSQFEKQQIMKRFGRNFRDQWGELRKDRRMQLFMDMLQLSPMSRDEYDEWEALNNPLNGDNIHRLYEPRTRLTGIEHDADIMWQREVIPKDPPSTSMRAGIPYRPRSDSQ